MPLSWLSCPPFILSLFLPLLVCLIFALDVLTPRGYVIAIAYVVPLCLTFWLLGTALTVTTAVITVLLTVVAEVYAPADLSLRMVLLNRALVVLTIVLCSLLLLGIKTLITNLEQRVAERTSELERLNTQLQHLSNTKTLFVSLVAHDLRTPLTAMKGYLENMLIGVFGPLNADYTNYVRRMLENIDRLTRLIRDILDLTAVESGRVQLTIAPLPIGRVLEEVIETMRPVAQRRNVRLVLHCEPNLPALHADRDKVEQVLTNLLDNAIKFTEAGTEVSLSCSRHEAEAIRVAVQDAGPGIAAEDLPHLFEPFFRGQVSGEQQGWGLGLAIVKHLVELQGGRLWAEAAAGGGAVFAMVFPIGSKAAQGKPQLATAG